MGELGHTGVRVSVNRSIWHGSEGGVTEQRENGEMRPGRAKTYLDLAMMTQVARTLAALRSGRSRRLGARHSRRGLRRGNRARRRGSGRLLLRLRLRLRRRWGVGGWCAGCGTLLVVAKLVDLLVTRRRLALQRTSVVHRGDRRMRNAIPLAVAAAVRRRRRCVVRRPRRRGDSGGGVMGVACLTGLAAVGRRQRLGVIVDAEHKVRHRHRCGIGGRGGHGGCDFKCREHRWVGRCRQGYRMDDSEGAPGMHAEGGLSGCAGWWLRERRRRLRGRGGVGSWW